MSCVFLLFFHQENEGYREQEKRRKRLEEERKRRGEAPTGKISESDTVISP